MSQDQPRRRRVLPAWGKIGLVLGAPVVFLCLLELGLAVAGYQAEMVRTFYDTLPATKRAGVVRICVVGGSAAAGWPFAPRGALSGGGGLEGRSQFACHGQTGTALSGGGGPVRFLGALLRDVAPGQPTEVFNCAVNALTSAGVEQVVRRLMAYEPDVLIVYSGHNEFFHDPALTRAVAQWEPRPVAWHRRTRTFRLLHAVASVVRGGAADDAEHLTRTERATTGQLGPPRDFAPGKLAAPLDARLRAIAELAKGHGVAVVLTTLASNLRNVPSTKPSHRSGLTGAELATWRTAYREGRALAKDGRAEAALAAFERAAAIDGHHAGLLYEQARCHAALGRADAAKPLFIASRDRDYMPMRATTARNQAVRRVAMKTESTLADAEGACAQASPHGIAGDELFCDHVHLSLRGAMVVATCWARALERDGLLGPQAGWTWGRAQGLDAYAQALGLGPQQQARAHVAVGRQCAMAEAGGRRVDELRRPQLVDALRARGVAQLAAGLRLDPTSGDEVEAAGEPFTSGYLAWAWVAVGQPERGVRICQELVDVRPECALLYLSAADAYAACGNEQKAAVLRTQWRELTRGTSGGGDAADVTPGKETSR